MKVIALGMGMQSTALYLMSSMRLFERADVAIFSDPMAEHPDTYKIVDWLLKWEKECADAIPIHIVKKSIIKDILKGKNTKGKKMVSLPLYVDTKKKGGGIMRRQCTYDYKINPVQQKVRELYGLKPRQKMPMTEMWLGITIDEAQRMKDSMSPRTKNRYPFMELNMNRGDCMNFMRESNYPIPRKSSCIFCPYSPDTTWIDIKTNKPNVFNIATKIDKKIRNCMETRRENNPAYLHRSMKPLEEVVFKHEDQIDMFGNECEGHCGL